MQVQRGTSHSDASALSLDDGDNITLQVSSRPADEPSTERLSMTSTISGAEPSSRTTRSRTNRPWGGQGKGIASDYPLTEPYQEKGMSKIAKIDSVDDHELSKPEEMIVRNVVADSDDDDEGDDDDDDDMKSIITVSSSPDVPEDAPFGMSERPWKIESFTNTMRHHWETMYSTIQQTPLAGDWDATEAYQKEKDREMLMYIQDFPLADWVIPKQQAEMAYSQLIERIRWRSLGIAIYDQARIAHMAGPHAINSGMPAAHGYVSYKQQNATVPYEFLPNHVTGQPLQHQMHRTSTYTHHGPQLQVPPHLPTHNLSSNQAAPHATHRQGGSPHFPHDSNLSTQNQPKPTRFKLHGPKPKSAKKERKSLAAITSTTPPPAPPYTPRHKPIERKALKSKGKVRQNRKQAEAEIYPWHRQFDFVEAKKNAFWDDSQYDEEVLSQMARTRRDNRPILLELDDEQSGKQRNVLILLSRGEVLRADHRIGTIRQKKARKPTEAESNSLSDGEKGGKGGSQGRKSAAGSDPFHSGNFSFATNEDAREASITNFETPDEIIAAAEAGKVDWEVCKGIMICWNPGKKGATEQLIQSSFRIYDTLITRKQFAEAKVLTRRAAECIIDFCPDLLWRETLLRIVSEGGLGNKDVRDRFCLNGCYADKATITKRIAAALGQKQTPPKPKDGPSDKSEKKEGNEQPAEENYYASNGADFDKYIRFFGKRQSTRNQAKLAVLPSSSKRGGSVSDADKDGPGTKRIKLDRSDVSKDDTEGDVDTAAFADSDNDEAQSPADSPQDQEDHITVVAT